MSTIEQYLHKSNLNIQNCFFIVSTSIQNLDNLNRINNHLNVYRDVLFLNVTKSYIHA